MSGNILGLGLYAESDLALLVIEEINQGRGIRASKLWGVSQDYIDDQLSPERLIEDIGGSGSEEIVEWIRRHVAQNPDDFDFTAEQVVMRRSGFIVVLEDPNAHPSTPIEDSAEIIEELEIMWAEEFGADIHGQNFDGHYPFQTTHFIFDPHDLRYRSRPVPNRRPPDPFSFRGEALPFGIRPSMLEKGSPKQEETWEDFYTEIGIVTFEDSTDGLWLTDRPNSMKFYGGEVKALQMFFDNMTLEERVAWDVWGDRLLAGLGIDPTDDRMFIETGFDRIDTEFG